MENISSLDYKSERLYAVVVWLFLLLNTDTYCHTCELLVLFNVAMEVSGRIGPDKESEEESSGSTWLVEYTYIQYRLYVRKRQ